MHSLRLAGGAGLTGNQPYANRICGNAGGQGTATDIQGIGLLSGQTATAADGAAASQIIGAALFQIGSAENKGAQVTPAKRSM